MIFLSERERSADDKKHHHRPGDHKPFARVLALVHLVPPLEFLGADIERQCAGVKKGQRDYQIRIFVVREKVDNDESQKNRRPEIGECSPKLAFGENRFFGVHGFRNIHQSRILRYAQTKLTVVSFVCVVLSLSQNIPQDRVLGYFVSAQGMRRKV